MSIIFTTLLASQTCDEKVLGPNKAISLSTIQSPRTAQLKKNDDFG